MSRMGNVSFCNGLSTFRCQITPSSPRQNKDVCLVQVNVLSSIFLYSLVKFLQQWRKKFRSAVSVSIRYWYLKTLRSYSSSQNHTKISNIKTYDLPTVYTTILHHKLRCRLFVSSTNVFFVFLFFVFCLVFF